MIESAAPGLLRHCRAGRTGLPLAQTAALTGEQGHQYVIRTNTNSTVIGRTAALAASKREWKSYYFIGPDYEWGHRVNSDFWEFLQTKKAAVNKMGDLWPKFGERDYSARITAMLNAKFATGWSDRAYILEKAMCVSPARSTTCRKTTKYAGNIWDFDGDPYAGTNSHRCTHKLTRSS